MVLRCVGLRTGPYGIRVIALALCSQRIIAAIRARGQILVFGCLRPPTGACGHPRKSADHPDAKGKLGAPLCGTPHRSLRHPSNLPAIRAQGAIFGAPLRGTPHRSLRASEKNCRHPDDEGLHRADPDSYDGVVLDSGRRSPRSRNSRSGARHRGGRSALVSGLVW